MQDWRASQVKKKDIASRGGGFLNEQGREGNFSERGVHDPQEPLSLQQLKEHGATVASKTFQYHDENSSLAPSLMY